MVDEKVIHPVIYVGTKRPEVYVVQCLNELADSPIVKMTSLGVNACGTLTIVGAMLSTHRDLTVETRYINEKREIQASRRKKRQIKRHIESDEEVPVHLRPQFRRVLGAELTVSSTSSKKK
jgi:hypothetical protein